MIGYRRKKHIKGFTLVEVLITLVILSIIGVLLFPNFRRYQTTTQLKGFAENFTHVLKLAKENARAVEGSRVEFKRETTGNINDPVIYKSMEVKNLSNSASVRLIQIPEQITLTGIPTTDYFDFKQDGTVEDDMQIIIKSGGTKLEGIIDISKATGSIDINFKEREE